MSEFDSASTSFPRLNRKLRFAFAAALLGGFGCTVGAEPITDSPTGNAGNPGAGGAGNGTAGAASGPSSGATPGTGATGNGGSGPNGSGAGPGAGGSNPGAGNTGNGAAGSGTSGGSPTTTPTTPPPVGGELATCTTPAPRLVRRLNRDQFRNTLVRAFNNDPSVPTTDVIANPYTLRFHVDADAQVVRDLDAGLLMDYADEVATWAAEGNKFSAFASCTTKDANCGRQFIEGAALKLTREPIPADRLAAYQKLFDAEANFKDAATVTLSAMLQSPFFLYRREMGTQDAGTFKLTPYEVASQLSYFLTDSPPDSQLLEAAKGNRLGTQQEIDMQAERLLQTPEAKVALKHFVEGWLEVDGLRIKTKDSKVALPNTLREAMISETTETFLDGFYNGGDVAKLLTSKESFVNQELGKFYGLNNVTSATPTKVSLEGTNRPPGVLGHASFLTMHAQPENSSPLQRGLVIRGRLLCEQIPAVPAGLNTAIAAPGTTKTNRERFEVHSQQEPCKTCHKVFDPAGFAFEKYDGFGLYREMENGVPVNSTGALVGMPEGDIPLTGPQELVDYLSKSDKVRACLVRYWSYYAHGRDNWTEKKCNDDSIRREAGEKGYTLKSVLMGILHAPSFTRRVQDK